ncbi:MAG: hypothetical protein IKH22_07315, partial [Prevotella sp.]|nr:hypothetical protein [Prevotella sp.]
TIFHCAAAALLLAMLTSCQWMKEDLEDQIADNSASRYINITVSVSASENPVTRANPTGGETGDGLEKGLARENKVDNITLIFYEDNAGINTTNADTKVAFFATYPVTETDNNPFGHNHNLDDPNVGWTGDANHQESNTNEVIYSTGDQVLDENLLDVTKTYHAIVVANAPQALLSAITVNETPIAQVREMVVSAVYSGSGVNINAQNFVMSSERDATVTFTNRKTDEEKNTITYYFECIHIERLAARIDFWAKTKDPDDLTYKAVEYVDESGNDIPAGYRYNVGKKNKHGRNDIFVLTRITPFNLMAGDEYLLKRTNDANPYLAKETTANWVLDPYSAQTDGKRTAAHPDYLASTLTSVSSTFANDYTVTLSDCQTASTAETEGGKFTVTEGGVSADNIILNYPKENTLRGGVTLLYYYATGLAFEGYYFKAAGNSDEYSVGERKVFYYYLRHQGEQDLAYQALTALNTETLCPTTPAMNFGIVRNNIYRVSIESITPDVDDIKVTLNIKVKKWDKFVHTPIIM